MERRRRLLIAQETSSGVNGQTKISIYIEVSREPRLPFIVEREDDAGVDFDSDGKLDDILDPMLRGLPDADAIRTSLRDQIR